jgi:hypothetical protein
MGKLLKIENHSLNFLECSWDNFAWFLVVYRYLVLLGYIKIGAFLRILGLCRLFAFGRTAKFLGFCLVFWRRQYPGPEIKSHFGVFKNKAFLSLLDLFRLFTFGKTAKFIGFYPVFRVPNFWWSTDIWVLLGCIKINAFWRVLGLFQLFTFEKNR